MTEEIKSEETPVGEPLVMGDPLPVQVPNNQGPMTAARAAALVSKSIG